MRCTRLLLLVFLLPLLAACGEDEVALWGSVDEIFSLEFDVHRVRKQGTALRIEYVKELAGGVEEWPARVTVQTANLQIVPNSDLTADAFSEEIVQLERISVDQGEYPPIEGGTIHFDDYEFVRDGRISGTFTVLFENGRNLFGNFAENVEVIEEEP